VGRGVDVGRLVDVKVGRGVDVGRLVDVKVGRGVDVGRRVLMLTDAPVLRLRLPDEGGGVLSSHPKANTNSEAATDAANSSETTCWQLRP